MDILMTWRALAESVQWQGSWGYLGKLEFEVLNITWAPISIAPSSHRASTTGFNVSALVRVPPLLTMAFHSSPARHWRHTGPLAALNNIPKLWAR
jgi:hypothetical protein